MDKDTTIQIISSTIKAMNLPFELNVKKEDWKADIVVDYGKYKVAFNIGKSPRNVAEQYSDMRRERVCGCWILLSSKNPPYFEKSYPCFTLSEEGTIELKSQRLELQTFIRSIVDGKVRYAQNIHAKAIEAYFYQKECWRCHRPSYLYMVGSIFSEEGIKFEVEDYDQELSTNADIVNGVKRYLSLHPMTNIVMGDYKPRYSKTRRETYLSFGCPYCDSLFGNFFTMDEQMELIYDKERLPRAIVELNKHILVEVNQWYMMK